ncbi:RNA polymerase factor sigma-54 [Clostridium prolinivorans]|uniref:RNA polymerase factor sigma-54 n=1 Tax=Clostridium prolinivorans TaxID=2769420 RepID=UPI00196B5701|nr:RNA polymerase factor sigma-54 [Clostridium prolinivorans]
MNFNLNLTQEQKLIMTQEMQLSIKILQMSSLELIEHIENEVLENPVLEAEYNENLQTYDDKDIVNYKELIKYLEFDNYSHNYNEKNNNEDEISPFNFISEKLTLREYLINQIIGIDVKDYLKPVCEYIINNLDERGYLEIGIDEISKQFNIEKNDAAKALDIVQSLDPSGIAARNIKECLILQLKRKKYEDEKLYTIVNNYLENLAENKYSDISKALNISLKEVQYYEDIIKSLNPKPSSGFYTGEEISFIVPEAYIRKIGEEYHIIINDNVLPKLIINENYKEIVKLNEDKDAISYVKEKINNALFLMKSIEHRKSTIYKVLSEIVKIQKEYFDYGEKYLKPMTLKDIAEKIDMNESTVSRAIKDKYINTNRGLVKIKDLFTNKVILSSNKDETISTNIVKKEIKELIDKEDKKNPLSDQEICNILNKKGMNISRRTVAKYREDMNIKSSSKRKRF